MDSPLDLRELFAAPWEGTARLQLPWWMRWFPAPRAFAFRSEILNVSGDAWDVLDTTVLPNGRTQCRRMRARRRSADQVSISADDMPGGATITLSAHGFSFYTIRTPVLGPLRVPLHFEDSVRLDAAHERMVDRLVVRCLGLRVATIVMQLEVGGPGTTRRDRPPGTPPGPG